MINVINTWYKMCVLFACVLYIIFFERFDEESIETVQVCTVCSSEMTDGRRTDYCYLARRIKLPANRFPTLAQILEEGTFILFVHSCTPW